MIKHRRNGLANGCQPKLCDCFCDLALEGCLGKRRERCLSIDQLVALGAQRGALRFFVGDSWVRKDLFDLILCLHKVACRPEVGNHDLLVCAAVKKIRGTDGGLFNLDPGCVPDPVGVIEFDLARKGPDPVRCAGQPRRVSGRGDDQGQRQCQEIKNA